VVSPPWVVAGAVAVAAGVPPDAAPSLPPPPAQAAASVATTAMKVRIVNVRRTLSSPPRVAGIR
jgi:hypothetical protein